VFPQRPDYIIGIPFKVPHSPLRLPIACSLRLVVELSSVRGLAADYPILCLFKPSRLGLFHPYVVVTQALRASQQFKLFYGDYNS